MKKQLLKSALIAVAGVGLLTSSAMALPTLSAGYNWSSADYWTLTDFTTSNLQTQIQMEDAAYESNFGFYLVDDLSNPTAVTKYLKIYDKTAEPSFNTTTIKFYDEGSGTVKVSVNGSAPEYFSSTWGIYYEVFTSGVNDATADYIWHSDQRFNQYANGTSVDTDIEHVMVAFNADSNEAKFYLDDQLGGGDRDFTDMTVYTNDVAPVPEPATMLLFGAGIVGLAGIGRRKRNKV